MPFAIRNGVKLHLQELGEAAARSPVVMLHGLFVGSLATWYFTTAPALAASHPVLTYDLRGHGLSERAPRGYDVATMSRDLEAIADRFSRKPVHLVGHSYGAVIALRFALDHPERVEKLVLVEAPLPPSRLEELSAFTGQRPEEMLGALPEGLRVLFSGGGRRGRRLLESLRFLATESSLLADLREAEDFSDQELSRVGCPLLCVYGDRSSCLPAGRRLARVIPRAELTVLPGGHFLPVEAPVPLTERVVEFLDG